ncbi:MAG: DUF2304 domain-containing protein [Lachnospiraceae bacterium]|nr:DUF2304 domain-containing protein [Lachnospiraceae bacterium]
MSLTLRIILIIACVFTLVYIRGKIKKSKFKAEESMFWLTFVSLLLLISIFPQILTLIARVLGIQSEVNCIFMIIIFLLLIKNFLLSRQLSDLDDKVKKLVQSTALRDKQKEE